LRQYDANGNGILDKDEWSARRPELKPADRNGDGAIALDELQAWLAEYGQRGHVGHRLSGTGADGSSEASSSGTAVAGSGSGMSGARRFYRALTPLERLPEGLPEWFARKDTDADGQVSMAEFATSWTQEAAAEFAKHDLNNDGMITPAECLEAMKQHVEAMKQK